jgi:hypothetical protein
MFYSLRIYAFSRMLLAPSRSTRTMKGSAVVAIAVDRGGVSRDEGLSLGAKTFRLGRLIQG